MVVHEAADKSIVDPCYGYTVRCKPIRKVRDAPHVAIDGAGRVAGINEIFAVALCERRKDAAPQPRLRLRSKRNQADHDDSPEWVTTQTGKHLFYVQFAASHRSLQGASHWRS
jgi:hypothetical protein